MPPASPQGPQSGSKEREWEGKGWSVLWGHCAVSVSTLCPEAVEEQLCESLMVCSDLTFEPNKQLLEVELHKVEDLH